ncbi:SixA phosphatase family protein [Bifidobacterium callimiconis]|uniref:Phosphoglycerate mutase n=1 Tax=Bifidobacterium callimiconis TaxID=2306973 RepID=A0A430FHS5_9BIFI|nr:histidine phosphatase family protein [Bifidobacterium callimiconis]MBT1176431.1 histidine phosphatase family protein [Bifidobacterium callimiconis]RSX52444.1 phosphoglycerate mutase [Bifidobacterium callimiconis]
MVNLNKVAKKTKSYEYQLIIMRHANAESGSGKSDVDRELTDKGLKQAKKVGKALAVMSLIPDQIRCSGATRARQTLERMLKYFGDKPGVDYRKSLYEDGMQAILGEMSHMKPKTKRLMIVGHEPTVSSAAQWLASPDSDPALLNVLGLGLSTGSVVILGSDKPLAQWDLRSAHLIAILTPKDCAA